jgi:hypothetical protein
MNYWLDISESPEKIVKDDRVEYRLNGELHREDGPAVEFTDGDNKEWWISKEWWINGKRHREDGPAIEWVSGSKLWYQNDKCHREDGPAAEWSNGTKEWWISGQRHREDGPAIEHINGTKEWWINGQRVDDAVQPVVINETVNCHEYKKKLMTNVSWDGKKYVTTAELIREHLRPVYDMLRRGS